MSLQLGGTIGDIEGMPFIEAFRQFQFKVGSDNFANIHVSLVPQVSHVPPRKPMSGGSCPSKETYVSLFMSLQGNLCLLVHVPPRKPMSPGSCPSKETYVSLFMSLQGNLCLLVHVPPRKLMSGGGKVTCYVCQLS